MWHSASQSGICIRLDATINPLGKAASHSKPLSAPYWGWRLLGVTIWARRASLILNFRAKRGDTMRVLIIGKTVGIVELVRLLSNYKMFLCIFVKYTYMSI